MQFAIKGQEVHVVGEVEDLFGGFVVGAPVGAVAVGMVLATVFETVVQDGRGQGVGLVAEQALAVEARVGDGVVGRGVILALLVITIIILVISVILVMMAVVVGVVSVVGVEGVAVDGRGGMRLSVVVDLDGAVVPRRLQANGVGLCGGLRMVGHGSVWVGRVGGRGGEKKGKSGRHAACQTIGMGKKMGCFVGGQFGLMRDP